MAGTDALPVPESELIAADIAAYLDRHRTKSLLRLITCGSVDDGKSTLIGRLLYDSKMIFDDQLEALEADSKRLGTQGQAVASQQFDLEIHPRLGRQFGPGLSREHHQARQIVGRALGEGQDQEGDQGACHQQLNQDEGARKQPGVLPRQAGGWPQVSPPRGLKK